MANLARSRRGSLAVSRRSSFVNSVANSRRSSAVKEEDEFSSSDNLSQSALLASALARRKSKFDPDGNPIDRRKSLAVDHGGQNVRDRRKSLAVDGDGSSMVNHRKSLAVDGDSSTMLSRRKSYVDADNSSMLSRRKSHVDALNSRRKSFVDGDSSKSRRGSPERRKSRVEIEGDFESKSHSSTSPLTRRRMSKFENDTDGENKNSMGRRKSVVDVEGATKKRKDRGRWHSAYDHEEIHVDTSRPGLSKGSTKPLDKHKRRSEPNEGESPFGSGSEDGFTSEAQKSESEEDNFEGVSIRKPKDRMKAVDEEAEATEHGEPEMPPAGVLLQNSHLFKGFNVYLLQQLVGDIEERNFRQGDYIYKEGERQQWLGVLDSGSASVHVTIDGAHSVRLSNADLQAGDIFGELGALGVRETRTSSLIAESECHILLLEGRQLWAAVEEYTAEQSQLLQLNSKWKHFLSCSFLANCHPEVGYQLRMQGKSITMLHGETAVLASSSASGDAKMKQYDAAAIVETGRLYTLSEKREAHGPGSMVNESTVLGMRGMVSVQATEGSCCITLVSREVLWRSTSQLHKEREHFVKMTLERLPPSTFDISSCPILSYLQGSAGFWRIVQNLVHQRVCHPGMEISGSEDVTDCLTFFQQGSAEILIAGHKIGKVNTGEYCGELNFLGIAGSGAVTVRARDFCVLQAVHRAEVEPHLQRHHTVRARFRELSKLRPHYKRDSALELQIKPLQEVNFFHGVSEDFLHDLHAMLEDRMLLPKQTMMDPVEPTSFMCILLAGNADSTSPDGVEKKLVPGDIVGELGLICVSLESRDTVVATNVCCVQVLHRVILLELLQTHPKEKHNFEAIAKTASVKPSANENDPHSNTNIYMLPFFKNCGHRFLYLLDLHLERHMFFSDEVIVKENTEGEEMYILYSGTALVIVRGINVSTLVGGQCFGEMAVLGLAKKRTATIKAKIVCDVRILSSKSLEAAIKEFPEERARFESLAATRNRVSNESKSGGKVKQTSMFFVDCDPKFAAAISDLMEDQLYMPGQVLMKEGEMGDCMFLLHQGKAEVTANGVHVADLGDHDVVGEMAVLGFSPFRTATVTAKEVCFVQVLHGSKLKPVLKQFPEEHTNLRLKAAQRLECRYTSDSVRSLETFRSSPKPFSDFIDKHTERRVYFNGDVLVREGTHGSHLFMIFSGRVSIDIGGDVIAELGGGDIVGELSALSVVKKRSATATCKDICDVYTLSHAMLTEALEKWPDQSDRLKILAAKRMRANVERNTKDSFLINCPLFEQCSHKFLQCISMHLEDKLYMPGENLCMQGDTGDTMFILVSGLLDCVVGGIKVNELTQGSIIGEIAVLGLSGVRTATLCAKTVCLVQMLHRPIFMKYLSEFPREMIQFQEVGTARLEKTPVSVESNIFRKQLLFSSCEPEFLNELAKKLHRKFFFAGQKIVKEGSDSNEMYAIQQGHAVVERRGVGIGEIEAGYCFGEMAVMGITTTQTVTVRAEMLCDMQVLVRWDLEDLMKDHRQERKRLLRVIASMMREDLAEVTNLEILTEIPMFHEADNRLLQTLEQASEVELARKEELIFHEGDDMMFVLLQGMARVEVGGVAVRSLTEGDNFGSVAVLGLQENRNVCVRASSVCLALAFLKTALNSAVEECGAKGRKFFQMLHKKLQCEPDIRQKAVLDSPVLQHLELNEEQCLQMMAKCEEAIFMPDEAILHDDSEVLLFVLCGKVSVASGMDVIMLEKGSSCGEISADNSQGVAPNIHSVLTSKVMTLWRSAFFAVLETWSPIEKARVLAKLETVPRQRRNTAISGTSLRQRTDWLATSYINQVKMSLRVKVGRPKDVHKKLLWKAIKKHTIVSSFVKGLSDATSKKEQVGHEKREPEKTKTQLQMDFQEQLLRHDLFRLTALAKHTAEEAKKDQMRLRHKADHLRARARAEDDSDDESERGDGTDAKASSGSDDGNQPLPVRALFGASGFSSHRHAAALSQDTAEVAQIRQQNAITERRVEKLRTKLEQAYILRDELLKEFRCKSSLLSTG